MSGCERETRGLSHSQLSSWCVSISVSFGLILRPRLARSTMPQQQPADGAHCHPALFRLKPRGEITAAASRASVSLIRRKDRM
ncbi:Hypothetical protein NTJ_04597 [Nesidiocoris tenuis]|uniref:Uncharacterized protein n=1 Tax=Nesidiocoris tenuis TaxID=355587 RepID=A0ABN7AIA3_9HEMI|nr:Hypothetical protein NTJ_04597 [Nesidiocoris tenuis]